MKPAVLLLSVIGIATAAVFAMRRSAPPEVDPATLHEGTLASAWSPEEVFQKALRRRPASDDRIVHAERREWTKDPAAGISRWQWFLEIEPGSALKGWLRGQNPFSVQVAGPEVMKKVGGPPSWFPAQCDEFEILAGGSTGSLVLMWSRDGKTLYATSSGEGFAPVAPPAVAKAAPRKEITLRRLPDGPPPNRPTP